jgi:GTP-binding protein EngB required for normal cell division
MSQPNPTSVDSLMELVRETMALTGAQRPEMARDDAPVLRDDALRAERFYLVGLIGGKEVGKSALVNALVGQPITEQTSHGPGTQQAIAYAHQDQLDPLRELLEQEVPGQYRLVPHAIESLRQQVLVDLPDIDSHWRQHVEVTRRMLRHMLFPIWVQSVEKYADQQPREMLKKVSAGNAPDNFLFVLNKADQVVAREGPAAAEELREDYARRLASVLSLPATPRVWLVSAAQPQGFDLPELRQTLSRQKSQQAVNQSVRRAGRQRGLTVLDWLDHQDLPGRLKRMERLEADAQEQLADRLGRIVLEEAVPSILEDPAHRMALVDECQQRRMKRWPIVGIVHAVLSPVVGAWRRRLAISQQQGLSGPEALVGQYLHEGGRDLSSAVQTTFAHLQQSAPAIGELYRHHKLWESAWADASVADLRRSLAAVVQRQRQVLSDRVGARDNVIAAFLRSILTWGALLWFPIVQPVLEAVLRDWQDGSVTHVGLLVVRILGVTFLLQNASFLLLWFFVLWAYIRWNTQRRVDKQLQRLRNAAEADPSTNLTAAAADWLTGLTEPIHQAQNRLGRLMERITHFRDSLAA